MGKIGPLDMNILSQKQRIIPNQLLVPVNEANVYKWHVLLFNLIPREGAVSR